ncbi:hypothetical protein [Ruminococcus flavefaciens]|uniref:hypothetical protein n=1 Tax=Ruminococcus flavefaciens TaxID=1265 RepID=UPI0026EB7F6E|nr:hypothetical protein [Ruminococcus flavefaciens]MDD7516752.1 hypothetical protein [Ruminococcus flavefaciens]MDY5691957.1 hypothetical protein [Ruminococcus flavefaciens]
MAKTDFFDKEIDERTVEKISDDFPVLSDEEKDRIFANVERKLNIIENEAHSEEVSGVEEYVRPRWVSIISVAASAAVLFGGLGGGTLLMRNMRKDIHNVPAPENVTEPLTTSENSSFKAENTKKDSGAEKNNPVPKATAADDGYLANSALNTKDKPLNTLSAADASYNNLDTHENNAQSYLNDNETAEEEVYEPVVTDVPVPAEAVDEESNNITTTDVQKSEQDELLDSAEKLIAEYDNIKDIKNMNLPVVSGGEYDTITCVYNADILDYSYTLQYRRVDPEIYPDMDTLKEYYYSVICSSKKEEECFGPELYSQDYPDGLSFDSNCPKYSFITYDGRLYERMEKQHDFIKRTDEAAEIYNVSDLAFTAVKKYIDPFDENNIIEVTFSIVKDFRTDKWSILNVIGYMYFG